MAMKTEIYYFSGSGNGFFLARGLKERLDAGTGGLSETAIVPLALERGKPRISSADRVGIVFPVYFLDLPNIVKEFIASLGVKKGAYVFTASSCGLDDSGVALKVRRLLARKGIELSAAFRFILPDNSIVFPTPKIRHEAMISKAIADLDCAAAAILSKKPIFQATGSRASGIGGPDHEGVLRWRPRVQGSARGPGRVHGLRDLRQGLFHRQYQLVRGETPVGIPEGMRRLLRLPPRLPGIGHTLQGAKQGEGIPVSQSQSEGV
jgi:hypothetical protein